MATKLQSIFDLSQDTLRSLSNYENWISFLKTAAWQYKYSFEDQILIYAQRRDATACASMEVWNKNLHRWINRGAKGIALLRDTGNRYSLEYVFDVSDTNDRYNRDINLWKYDDRYKEAVTETLKNTFGELAVDTIIEEAIHNAVINAVEDNKEDYLSELDDVKDNSLLYGLDKVNVDLRFRQTAAVSSAYMIMRRMGLSPDDTLSHEDFEYIADFSTPETMSVLGNAVSAISETALRDISQTIRAEQKKFAQARNVVYNREQEANTDERNDENGGDSIQNGRRIRDTGSYGSDRGTSDREVRNDETDIPQTEQESAVFDDASERHASRPLGGDGQDSGEADTDNSITDGESGGSNGNDESQRPYEMDRLDEQLSPFGGSD